MMRKRCGTFPASFGGARYCVTILQAISGGLPHDHGTGGPCNTDSHWLAIRQIRLKNTMDGNHKNRK
jgi:hypothetical protein